MATDFIPNDIAQFKIELDAICKKYNVTEMVALVEHRQMFTAVVQFSNTGRKNIYYNNIQKQFQIALDKIEKDIGKKN